MNVFTCQLCGIYQGHTPGCYALYKLNDESEDNFRTSVLYALKEIDSKLLKLLRKDENNIKK